MRHLFYIRTSLNVKAGFPQSQMWQFDELSRLSLSLSHLPFFASGESFVLRDARAQSFVRTQSFSHSPCNNHAERARVRIYSARARKVEAERATWWPKLLAHAKVASRHRHDFLKLPQNSALRLAPISFACSLRRARTRKTNKCIRAHTWLVWINWSFVYVPFFLSLVDFMPIDIWLRSP